MSDRVPLTTMSIALRWLLIACVGGALWLYGQIWWDDRRLPQLWAAYVVAGLSYAVWLVILEGQSNRRRDEWKGNRCPTCGYDLRATPDRCPECGTEQPKDAA